MPKSLQELVAATSELRALPSTTIRLMTLLDDATVEASLVLEVIEKDPSLTANLLKLANSAYYGLRRQVGSVREALILLGNQTIVNLAFATSMGDILRGPLRAYHLDRNELWHHALGTALGAAYLISLAGGKDLRERAFTGGLVHDIGKLILNKPLQQEIEKLPADCDFERLLETESNVLGFNHAEAGGALAESWNFPPSLVRIITSHHDPLEAEEDKDLVRVVAAANLVSCFLGFGRGTVNFPEEYFWSTLDGWGFPESVVRGLNEELPGDLQNMLGIIGETR